MASSSSIPPCKYQVFLTFSHHEDNHEYNTFVDCLHQNFILKGIHTNKDIDEKVLERGKSFSPDLDLLKAIEESRILVVVLSENYASSSCCLDQLVKIMDCWEKMELFVVPIFYNVDPSTAISQTGNFQEIFRNHEENFKDEMERVQKWRDALTKVATICGWDSRTWEEKVLIEEIIRDISDKLIYISSRDTWKFIGMGFHITEMEKILCLESNVVYKVGIWGMGGIGKTTIAKLIYDRILNQFEVGCFLENVKGEFRNLGAAAFQEKLLSKCLLLESKHLMNKWTPNAGFNMMKKRLRRKKILLVLDDVDDWKQLEILAKYGDWFGPGSRIIITSRDKQLLEAHGVFNTYEVTYLETNQALQLFSQHAFKQNNPIIEYLKLSEQIASYAKGLPLALKVVGSFLNSTSIFEWQSLQKKLATIPDLKIHDVLRISFDGLDDTEKDVFLDMACFFIYSGVEFVRVRDILECCSFFPDIALSVLKDKALITISGNCLGMHDLLREMGQEIVRQESKEEPGKRSRLWISKDIYHVLKQKTGTEKVEGISLNLSKITEMHLEPDAFAKMNRLRLLKFYSTDLPALVNDKVHFPRGFQSLSNELRYLYWHRFPMKSLPSNFCAEKLVELRLPNCKVEQLWTQVQPLVNLKRFGLPGSDNLTRFPDLSLAKNIESINLHGCKSLVELHPSVQYLSKLEYLNVTLCESLKSLPCRIDSKCFKEFLLTRCYNVKTLPEISANLKQVDLMYTAVKELPESIYKLTDLHLLDLTGCSNLTKFPEISGSLRLLYICDTAIEEVPSSIQFLSRLVQLKLKNNKKLLSLSGSICKLKCLQILDLSGCSKFESFPEILEPMEVLSELHLSQTAIKELPSNIEQIKFLKALLLDECKNLVTLPSNIHKVSELEIIDLRCCESLHSIPELPSSLKILLSIDCELLETVSSSGNCNFDYFHFGNCFKLNLKADAHLAIQLMEAKFCNGGNQSRILFPGIEIPRWFSDQSVGSLLTIQLPSYRHQFKGIAFCVVLALVGSQSLSKISFPCECRISCECYLKVDNFEGKLTVCSWKCFEIGVHLLKSDHVFLWYNPEESQTSLMNEEGWFNKYSGHEASIEFKFEGNSEFNKHCRISKCGIRLLYGEAKSSRSFAFDNDEEELLSKRFKYSGGQNLNF